MENNNMENNVELAEDTQVATEQPVEQPVEAAPEAAPEAEVKAGPLNFLNKAADACRNGFDKFMVAYKQDPKKMGIFAGAAGLAVVALVVVLILLLSSGNSYKTPVNILEDYANTKKYYDQFDQISDMLNGFAADEYDDLIDLMKDSEYYQDNLEDLKADFEEAIEEKKDEYGSNYKVRYTIDEKEELESADLREFRDQLRSVAKSLESIIDETDDWDPEDWEEMADEMGFDGDKSKAREVVSLLNDLRKVYKSAKVTDGYRLWITVSITGSELDEPEESEIKLDVYEVDGRWVSSSVLYAYNMFN